MLTDGKEAPYLFNIEPHFPFEHTRLNIVLWSPILFVLLNTL